MTSQSSGRAARAAHRGVTPGDAELDSTERRWDTYRSGERSDANPGSDSERGLEGLVLIDGGGAAAVAASLQAV
jgi:hypothetical protein